MSKTYRCEKCGDMTVKLSDELIDNIRASMLDEVIEHIKGMITDHEDEVNYNYIIKELRKKYGVRDE